MTAFRVFSGWDPRQAEAAEVFAYSVRENASIPVEVMFAAAQPDDSVGWSFNLDFRRTGVTSFSYARFLVPWACGYEGVALFADGCDQLCLGDVAELAALDMGGCAVRVVKHRVEGQKRPRVWSSVMLLDCAKLNWWTPAYVENAPDAALMRFEGLGDDMIGDLPLEWNFMIDPAGSYPNELYEDLADLIHWSYLSDPNGGSWIQRSGSSLWEEWRQRWIASTRGPKNGWRAAR